MPSAETSMLLNSTIARLTHMVSGKIGKDWRSGRLFVLHEKGDEWEAIHAAINALRTARDELKA